MINNRAVIMPILVLLSIQGFVAAVLYFNQKSESVTQYLTSEIGQVAGTSTTDVINLTNEIPMIPNAEVVSVDTSIESASVTLDSSLPEEEIKTYYEDYMFLNNWEQIGQNLYKRENRELKIEITENIVKLTLYSKK